MRNKKFITALLAGAMMSAISFASFAGTWQSDANGWWWQEDDGSYPVNSWQWIDGNNDNVSERYYFNSQGYMLANTTAPDGSVLNADGAWTVNGTVQTTQILNIDSYGYNDKINNLVYDLMNSTMAENRQKYGIPDLSPNGYTYPACPYFEVQYGMPGGGISDTLGYDTENDYPWHIIVKSGNIPFNKLLKDAPDISEATTLDEIKEYFEGLGYSVTDAHSAIDSSDRRIVVYYGNYDIQFDAPRDGVLSSWVDDSGDFIMYIGQERTDEAQSAWQDVLSLPTVAG